MLSRHHSPGASGIEIVLRYTLFASAKGGLTDLQRCQENAAASPAKVQLPLRLSPLEHRL